MMMSWQYLSHNSQRIDMNNQSDFCERLYRIKPYKQVSSPSPNKHPHQQLFPVPPTRDSTFESRLMENLSQTIEMLFDKIDKIKCEFDPERIGVSPADEWKQKSQEKLSQKLEQQNYGVSPVRQRTVQAVALSELSLNQVIMKNCSKPDQNIDQAPPSRWDDQSSMELRMSDFELGRCVGSGKFGDVHQVRHKATNTLFALKKILKSTILEYNMADQFVKELKIHYSLDHPNVVQLYTHFEDEYHVFLLLEYAEGGSLIDCLPKNEPAASQLVEQILNVVEFMQRKSIAHRDIKPENIVMCMGGVAKLCDFGWASTFQNAMRKTFCGTLDYVSPEMKDVGEHGISVDLWSVGVLTFELLSGFPPYKQEISSWRMRGSRRSNKWNWEVVFPAQFSNEAKQFITGLLRKNPEERATVAQCRTSSFLAGNRHLFQEGLMQNIDL